MKKLAVIVGLLLLGFLPYAVATPPAKKAQGEPVSNGYDPEVRAQEQQALCSQLWAEKLPVATAAVSVRLSPEEAAGISGEIRGGMLAAHPGGMTWAAAVDAVDATALGLHFTAFKLPANAQLYIFNEKGQVDGPYTDTGSRGNGNFWSHTIRGSLAYVQVQFDGQPSDEDLRGSHFVIADVAHIGPLYQDIEIWNTCRSIDEGCVRLIIDPTISANSANSAVDNARLAIAHMQFASGGSIYICSGGLLADTDTDPNSERNYFLTANYPPVPG